MPRKNKHTSKHNAYVKPDYHSQNRQSAKNNDQINKKKKKKLRTAYSIYKRLLHDPCMEIDLNYIYIGYRDTINTQEMPILDWKMIEDGGDVPMHRIIYFTLYLIDNTQIRLWDKKTKLDRLYCSAQTNKNTQSLKSLLSQINPTNIPKIRKQQQQNNNNGCIAAQNKTINILDSLIQTFSVPDGISKPIMPVSDNRRIGILFMGGSFNPVHSQHIKLMSVVKKYFESNMNINVIGAYLVITTDGYVYGKLKNEAISFEHRKTLCELLCNDKDLKWLHPSDYPCGSAIQYLQKEFSNKYPNALMINCMGADKILKNKRGKWRQYSKSYKNRKCLTVCINRRGYSDRAYELYVKDVKAGLVNSKAFMFIDVNVEQLSSTLVRSVLKNYEREMNGNNKSERVFQKYKEQLKGYMNQQCIDYLLNNIHCLWF